MRGRGPGRTGHSARASVGCGCRLAKLWAKALMRVTGSSYNVATVTEVAHYLRLLYAKVGELHCPRCDTVVETTAKG